jgi:hypothetical protein
VGRSSRFHNSSQSIGGEQRHHDHLKAHEKRLLRNCFLSFTNQQVLLNSMLQGNHFPTEAAFSPFAVAYRRQVNSLSLSGWLELEILGFRVHIYHWMVEFFCFVDVVAEIIFLERFIPLFLFMVFD